MSGSPPPPRSTAERLGAFVLRLLGWRISGDLPAAPKGIVIVAPHTSNWDFLLGLACGYAAGLLSRWPYGFYIKAVLFRGPLGTALRALGGIPIDRSAPHDAVRLGVERLGARGRYLLAITPEGTRRRTEHWRSGFYHIARSAGVPVVPVAFDYGRRECRIGPEYRLTGDMEADLEAFRRFYAGVTGRHPERFGPIRFREQEEESPIPVATGGDRVTELLRLHGMRLLAIPGVVGVGEGRRGGRTCVVVMVNRRTPETERLIPREMEGIPVEVEEGGTIRARP